ncbi:phage tail assembly protein [Collimonas fungivorans]|uniref:Phage tail E family protein n=1 Tax=Collimonas fungivorans (strain Ter331) TaxID=1005048 RepID=G0AIR4_COLFT|nr:phage tail assembly protein [Collimonas fungivorans]AEK60847.1 phage tail E family protein [Collimonas fungivorans Ter331]
MNKNTDTTNSVAIIGAGTYKTVVLDEPLTRGASQITEVQIRKPKSGELRGVSLIELGQMDVSALQRVLPRITSPILTTQDVANLDPADLVSIGAEVAYFLVKKADRQEVSPTV